MTDVTETSRMNLETLEIRCSCDQNFLTAFLVSVVIMLILPDTFLQFIPHIESLYHLTKSMLTIYWIYPLEKEISCAALKRLLI